MFQGCRWEFAFGPLIFVVKLSFLISMIYLVLTLPTRSQVGSVRLLSRSIRTKIQCSCSENAIMAML